MGQGGLKANDYDQERKPGVDNQLSMSDVMFEQSPCGRSGLTAAGRNHQRLCVFFFLQRHLDLESPESCV